MILYWILIILLAILVIYDLLGLVKQLKGKPISKLTILSHILLLLLLVILSINFFINVDLLKFEDIPNVLKANK